MESDALIKGFFFVFVHKDFIVREIVTRVQDQLPFLKDRRILDQLERDYKTFMEADLVTWTNVMLHCEIFQSYQSIVTPNEASLVRTSRTKAMSDSCEGANFLLLQRRFVKIFLNSYNRAKNLISLPFTATTASV
jgi:hypothetical protein